MDAELVELVVADDPELWGDLGFAVSDDGVVRLGGVAIRLAGAGAGEGLVGWRVRGLEGADLDGLPRCAAAGDAAGGSLDSEHPNGAVAVDHVVALTDDFARTVSALQAAGIEPRRVRAVPGGPMRQAFYVLGTALLELGGPVDGRDGAGLWGVTLAVADLDALAERLGDRLGTIRDAVQPGRRIATLRREAGSSVPLAFMTPR